MLKLKLQYFGHLMQRTESLEKTLMLGKIEGRRRRGMIEDEMAGWHHRFNGHEFEQTQGDSEGHGSLTYYSSWDCNLVTEQQQHTTSGLLFRTVRLERTLCYSS